MLLAYDRFLHTRVFNPLFRWVQKLLHVNRWHLLIGVQVLDAAVTAGMLIASFALFLSGDTRTFWLAAAVALLFLFVARVFGEQRKRIRAAMALLAEKFEEGRKAVPSEELLMEGVGARRHRVLENIVATGMILAIPLDWVFTDITPLVEFYTVCFTIHLCTECIAGHLWDIDSIDPEERSYLLGRNLAEDSVT